MQKKVLASLLVTPLAFNAFANITVNENLAQNGSNWNQTGISGANPFQGGGILCPIGSGILTMDLGNLNPGKYVLKFAEAKNIRASVSDGVSTPITSNGEDLVFEVAATSKWTLTITGAQADNEFSLKGIAFEIVFDVDAIKTTLNNALDNVVIDSVKDEDKSEVAEGLRKDKEALDKKKTDLATKIGGLTETKEVYDEFKLWLDDNEIQKDIDALAKEVEEYNAKVKAENDKYDLGVANTQAKNELLAKIDAKNTGLQALLNAQTARYDKENKENEGIDPKELTYVSETNNGTALGIQGEIDTFRAAIEEAYKGDNIYKEDITVDDKSEAIEAQITELASQITASIKDWTVYSKLMELQTKLTAETSTTLELLGGEKYKGAAGMDKSFNAYVAEQEAEIRKIYSDALAAVATKRLEDPTVGGSLAGVSANEKNDTKILTDATNAVVNIRTAADAAQTKYWENVATVNEALKAVNELPTTLPEGFPETEVTKFNDLLKAANDAADALRTQVDGQYDADLDTTVAKDTVKAVNDFLAAWQPILGLINDLKILRDETIPGLQAGYNVPTSEFDLSAKFVGTIASLDEAIKAIYNGKTVEELQTQTVLDKVQEVKDAIAERGKFATTLISAYVEASASVADFQNMIDGLDKDIEDKLIVNKNADPAGFKTTKTYTDLAAKLKEVSDDLIKVRSNEVSPQVSYETAVALQGKVEGYPDQVAAAVHEFEKTYTGQEIDGKTTGNWSAVDTALADLNKYAAEGDYYGKTTDFSDLQTELDGIVTKIQAANALANDNEKLVETYAGIDTELQALFDKIAAKKAEVKALKDNQAAYDELLGLVAGTDDIDALAKYNIDNSDAPAEDYFKDEVIGHETPAPATGLYKERLDLLATLRTALEEKTAATGKKALSDKVTAFNNKIAQTYKDIYANNTSYAAQNIESTRVREYIDDLIDEINTKATEASVFEGSNPLNEAVTGWISSLTSLRDQDLNNEDLVANGYYGKGQSASKNDEVMAEYKRIEDLAKAIEADFNDNFFNKVAETNQQTVENANWDVAVSYTESIYREAIQTYNSFFQLNNPYYSQYILTVVQTHRDIYQYSKQITDLKAEVDKTVATYNEDGDVFTADEFKEFALDKANALIIAMNGKVEAMMKLCNEAAQHYYNGQDYTFETTGNDEQPKPVTAKFVEAATSYAEAQAAIESAEKALDEAGINNLACRALALKTAYAHLKAASDTYSKNENSWLLALNFMNKIANDLDAVASSINLDAAAVGQWTANYESASQLLGELKTQLEGCTSDGDEAREQLAAYIDQAAGLNAQATTMENFTSKTSKLHVIIDAAQSLVDQKQTQWDNDQANKELAAEFQSRLDKLMADYYALAQYVGSITANVSLDNINDAIASVKAELEADKASLVENKDKIEGLFETAENDIFSTYSVAQLKEIQSLYDLLAKTKVAFNNAKVLSTTLTAEELAAIDTRITEIEKGNADGEGGIYNLVGFNATYNNEDATENDKLTARADFLTLAQSIENELSEIYVKLMKSYESQDGVVGGDPVPGIIADLTEQYVALESQITDAQEAFVHYFEIVQTKYPDGYNNLMENLEAVKALWEADGNKVVLNAGNYKNDMEAIAKEFNTLKGKIEAAQADAQAKYEAMQANDAAFERLENELKGYEEQFEALTEVVGSYDLLTTYKEELDNIGDRIEDARVWLNDEHARCQLTADSNFGYPYNTIYSDLYRLSVIVENTHVNDVRIATWRIINGAYSILYNNTVVPEIRDEQLDKLNDLQTEMGAINDAHNTLINEWNNGTINNDAFIAGCRNLDERYQKVCDDAQAIQTVAHDNIFFKGDLNDAPDGKVNATDLQILIGWILDGITYEELFEQSPVQAAAADLAEDKQINIADATDEVELILNQENGVSQSSVAPRLARRAVRSGENSFGLSMLTSENGTRDYALTLVNADTFIAGQFDVQLPAGMSIKDVQLDARAANHEVMFAENGNGTYRIVVISMTNEPIEGNNGVLLHIITDGIGTPALSNGIFADDNHAPVKVSAAETSMIDAIHTGAVNVKDRIYDAAGRAYNKLQRGINIIRHADGTTTKEIHK